MMVFRHLQHWLLPCLCRCNADPDLESKIIKFVSYLGESAAWEVRALKALDTAPSMVLKLIVQSFPNDINANNAKRDYRQLAKAIGRINAVIQGKWGGYFVRLCLQRDLPGIFRGMLAVAS